MSLNPIKMSQNIIDDYRRYLNTTFFINDAKLMENFRKCISEEGKLAKGPYVDFTDPFMTGESINQLIDNNTLSKQFEELFKNHQSLLNRPLYFHQSEAIRKIVIENKNVVVTTGTGSGKTESFLYPIINYLMRQKENKQLSPGVRALLIYPMNALAYDQIKRLREILQNYPDITFGVYSGDIKEKKGEALKDYSDIFGKENKPLKNELISREEMKANPPHILITNYAMLEYLLMRPADNVFFDGVNAGHWKYIVLDEAHTYTGAKGIEISMLLRRLKFRLYDNEKVRFILTSATLGDVDKNGKIVEFANKISADSFFDVSSIVRATRETAKHPGQTIELPIEMYSKLFEYISKYSNVNDEDIYKILSEYTSFDNHKTYKEIFFDLLQNDDRYYKLRNYVMNESLTIIDLCKKINMEPEELISFIHVASMAVKNDVRLVDGRYHLFIRSLEGAFVTLDGQNKVDVIPQLVSPLPDYENNSVNIIEGTPKVIDELFFNIVVCGNCGQIYTKGKIVDNRFIQKGIPKIKTEKTSKITSNKLFLLTDIIDASDLPDNYIPIYKLCGRCGKVIEQSKKHIKNDIKPCDCSDSFYRYLIMCPSQKDDKNNGIKYSRCISCDSSNRKGIIRDFYVGQDALSSVICSSIYDNLPDNITRILDKNPIVISDLFGTINTSERNEHNENIEKLDKQLLAFSDSRQDAAYFACYFDSTYKEILRKRSLYKAIKDCAKFKGDELDVVYVIDKLSEIFLNNNIFNKNECEKEAWKTILWDIYNNDRDSLENSGLISYIYQGIRKSIDDKTYKMDEKEFNTLQCVLMNCFRWKYALKYPDDISMKPSDKEFYSPWTKNDGKIVNTDDATKYEDNWVPKEVDNKQSNYLKRIFNVELYQSQVFLQDFWRTFINEKYIDGAIGINNFKIVYSPKNMKWYKCDTCGKITIHNIRNVCPGFRCDGELYDYIPERDDNNNHYRELFKSDKISKMEIREHTAQLSVKNAKDYQTKFINKDINILSCSTTFEMGVDVGDLETVFMRNMPPSPANYIQRAGRAGRRTESTAFSLTLCRLRSHDMTFLKDPSKMIKGCINPPLFEIENEKIIKRHVNAVLISAFWRKLENVDYHIDNAGKFYENFDKFIEFVNTLDDKTIKYLTNILPEKYKLKIRQFLDEILNDKSGYDDDINEVWKEKLIFTDEITEIEKKICELEQENKENINKSIVYSHLGKLHKLKEKILNEQLIQYLSRKCIIPRYGFPVDTVELYVLDNGNDGLRLQRNLQLAISEYSPGSQIIADKYIYTSRYIKKHEKEKGWSKYRYAKCDNCGKTNVERLEINELDNQVCEVCELPIKYNLSDIFIEPRYGFKSELGDRVLAGTNSIKKHYNIQYEYKGNKRAEKKIKDADIKSIILESKRNDEIMVLNDDNFEVCEVCGIAYNLSSEGKKLPGKHRNSFDHDCKNETISRTYKLGHIYKTDVVCMNLGTTVDGLIIHSILNALLRGISQYFMIELSEIDGCFYTGSSDDEHSQIVLFDTVPGGAGYVRKLIDKDVSLREIFKQSLEIVKNCICNENESCYSCLRSYNNQKYHDVLKRVDAINYFEELLNK